MKGPTRGGRLHKLMVEARPLVPHLVWVLLAVLLALAAVLVATGDAVERVAEDARVQAEAEAMLGVAGTTRAVAHEAIVVGRAWERGVAGDEELEAVISDLRLAALRLEERAERLSRLLADPMMLASHQGMAAAAEDVAAALEAGAVEEAESALPVLSAAHQDLAGRAADLRDAAGASIVVTGEGLAGVTTAARFMVALVIPLAAMLMFYRSLRAGHRRRLLEDELKRQKILSRERDRFMQAVSHHLNTPLAAVLGFAELLRDRARSFNAGARNEIIEMLAIQAEEMDKVVNDLIVSTRLRLGELTVLRDDVDLRPVLDDVVRSWQAPDRARLTVVGDAVATGDAKWIGHIMRNLLQNALVFGGDEIEVRVSEGFHCAVVDVCDRGERVSPEDREKIFEPYYTGSNDQGLAPSLGLGLAVARNLARAMGGEVSYEEEDGEKMFRLRLPGGESTDRPAREMLLVAVGEDRPTGDMVAELLARGGPSMAYQPIVNMVGGPEQKPQVVGYEALARFPVMDPWEWFRAAARAGIRQDLELSAIRNAVAGFAPPEPDAFLSVNLSEPTLTCSSLVASLEGIDPALLVLELSEAGVIKSYEAVLGAVDVLSDQGYRLGLDDVGAGEIDLWHVTRLHPAMIKIDLSLVRGLEENPRNRALVHAIVALADDLGMVVVAEGVESPEERDALLALSVQFGQGYLFGRPRPLEWKSRVLSDVG